MKYSEKEMRDTAFMTKAHNVAFYQINNRQTLGDCMFLLNKYKPKSLEDFFEKYTTDDEDDGNPQHRGRTFEELEVIANTYKALSGDDLPLETYIKNILWHTIVQTWDGYKRECELQGYAALRGYDLRKCNHEDDATLGIDFEMKTKDGKLKCFIQLKPETFIIGNHNQSLKKDRQLAILKEKKVKLLYDVPTYYIFYKKDGSYKLNDNNKICHKIRELINTDGTLNIQSY